MQFTKSAFNTLISLSFNSLSLMSLIYVKCKRLKAALSTL